jgi:hypothetical protein
MTAKRVMDAKHYRWAELPVERVPSRMSFAADSG